MTAIDRRALGRAAVWLVAAILTYKVGRAAFLNAQQHSAIDFYYFWDAARNLLQGQAEQAYAPHVSAAGPLVPMAYPPPFLLLLAPLGALGFGAALGAWLIVTGILYLVACRQPLRIALANPAAAYNGLFGQTGFLTAAIMLGAAELIRRRPWAAGALFGCMVVKPHLALFVPLALAAGRHWSALAAAALSALALLGLAAAAFGPGIYPPFLGALGDYGDGLWTAGWDWDLLASFYALFRWIGLAHWPALGLHCLVAIAAGAAVWTTWREKRESRVAALAAGTLLASPYLFTYDAVLLVAPIGFLAAQGRTAAAVAIGGLAFLPLASTTLLGTSMLPGLSLGMPNATPIAAVVALVAVTWADGARRRSEA